MWDQSILHSFRKLSVQSILLLVTTVIVVAFAYLFTTAPTTFAASDATWNADGSGILYQGNLYTLQTPIAAGSSTGLAEGTKDYVFTTQGSTPTALEQANFLTFAPTSDPTTSLSADYETFTFAPPDTFSAPSAKKTISLTPQTTQQNSKQVEQCNIQGIGWFLCPVTNFMSTGMDWLFGKLSDFLIVQPISNDQQSSLYRAWSMMRNLANIAFVMAFMIIIYSQLTSIGLSNYGIKRLLPRIIVAAILVNISYWICSIGVDLSNISGTSIQGIFDAARDGLALKGQGNSAATAVTFANISTFALSSGTVVAAGLVGWGAFAAGAGSSIIMLLPILVSTVLAALVALLIMAARQALVILLIIVSPLAFVAYLLPNTEKLFKKWHELFTTMLLVFPMFALVFSGAQLAGSAIIQNATSLTMIILGMGVKVAPLVITPFLIRISGTLLGRIAGIANNPNKGLIDRTRKFSEERKDAYKARALAKGGVNQGVRKYGLAARAQRKDAKDRKRTGWQKANEARNDANWENSSVYSDIQQYDMKSSQRKDIGTSNAQNRYATSQRLNSAIQALDLDARAAKLRLDVSKAQVEGNWNEIKAGDGRSIVPPGAISASSLSLDALQRHQAESTARAQSILQDTIQSKVEARRNHSAEEMQDEHYEKAMLSNVALQKEAGGIAPRGADSALAAAVTAQRSAYAASVKEAEQIMRHFNASGTERQDIAFARKDVELTDDHGNTKVFTKDNIHAREAAIEAQLAGEGSYIQIREIIAKSGSELNAFKTTIGTAIPANRLAEKAQFLGGRTIDDVKQGNIKSMADLDIAVARNISEGKIKAAQLSTMDPDALEQIFRVAAAGGAPGLDAKYVPALAGRIKELGGLAQKALHNETLSGNVTEGARGYLQKMETKWPPTSTP